MRMIRKDTRFFAAVPALLLLAATAPAQTIQTLENGNYVTALAGDAHNNLYVTRYNAVSDDYEVVKYSNSTGTPDNIYDGLAYNAVDYPWGLAVASDGDVYIGASNADNKVIKLAYDSALNTYTASTFLSGNYYAALALDTSDNLYTTEYDSVTSRYSIVKYAAGSTTGTRLYDDLILGPGYSYPTGLAVATNGDIYVTESFNYTAGSYGHVYKLTAASNYTSVSAVSSGKFSTSLALDPQGNLYCSEYDAAAAAYVLEKYTGGTGNPVALDTLFPDAGTFFPWGIVARNSGDLYYANGDDGAGGGGALLHLTATPEAQSSALSFTNLTETGVTAGWTRGSGTMHAVFIAQAASGAPLPVNGTAYIPDAQYGNGAQIGSSGWYCVYNDTGSEVTVTGLTGGTTYRVMVLDYNGAAGTEQYNTTTGSNIDNFVTPLPLLVTLTSLQAVYKQDAVLLSWETVTEVHNKQFTVQWSADGRVWQPAGTVASAAAEGNSSRPLHYAFRYDRPVPGINFFRLQQEDLDGRTTLSPAVQVNVPDAGAVVRLFPNPVSGSCTVLFRGQPEGGCLVLRNAAGKIIRTLSVTARRMQVDLSGMPAGIYFITVPGRDKALPVVKQ